jgi:hypothetical protein
VWGLVAWVEELPLATPGEAVRQTFRALDGATAPVVTSDGPVQSSIPSKSLQVVLHPVSMTVAKFFLMAIRKVWWSVGMASWSKGIVVTAKPGNTGSSVTVGSSVHAIWSQLANYAKINFVLRAQSFLLSYCLSFMQNDYLLYSSITSSRCILIVTCG